MSEIHEVCARFHVAIELVGARWTGAILRAVFTGSHRFAQIKEAIPGVSDTMLASRLRTLESESLITRTVLPTTPVQVEYHLTEKGLDLAPVLDALITWSHKWIPLPAGAAPED
ncbi:winged helix-turn-helix transcriptional regulator [Sphaerisporangium aureirubrum]|uniref:Winged helix-turn-helix transcriptional regulator n=1 Tax=Sphaerisporangium aureirubrum TaxID=1544736 RepID=A0ABW1NJB9_9ACTN